MNFASRKTPLKTPLKSRTASPRLHLLSPNNDDFERAQNRAAREASHRRKSIGLSAQGDRDYEQHEEEGSRDILGKDQILDLLQNCIKLAAENKINQKNTWKLGLIDHISEIVNADDGQDTETNFQKASCTLEAGVKIYAYRVDSVHSETYKVLGGLNRTAAYEEGREDKEDPQNAEASDEEAELKKKENQKKISSSAATLESYESLNVKKFDAAFTVDPLFNQMSAQFDEGGAKGLLLNNLSVYSSCKLVFDSAEIPTKYKKGNSITNSCETINLFSMRDSFEKLKQDIKAETEFTPTLQEILSMFDDPYRMASVMEGTKKNTEMNVEDYDNNQCSSTGDDGGMGEVIDDIEADRSQETFSTELADEISESNANWNYDGESYDDGVSQGGEIDEEASFCHSVHNSIPTEDDTWELVDWIGPVLSLRSNSWAGPDHWKFRKSQDAGKGPELQTKAPEKKKQKNEKFSIDFSSSSNVDMSILAPAADLKSVMLPQNSSLPSPFLPDDCHYQPENLVRLFLLPSTMCLRDRIKQKSGIGRSKDNAAETMNMQWDDGVADDWDGGNMCDEAEYIDDNEMVPQPRKVQKIEVDYDKTSKQIDVRVLKETLWQNLQETSSSHQDAKETSSISFKSVLHQVPTSCGAASAPGDISVHLCFICLLHLANEHNLTLLDCPTMDELYIGNVTSDLKTSELATF